MFALNSGLYKSKTSYDDNIQVVSRISVVERLLDSVGITIAGVQEGRAKDQQLIVENSYIMHVAGPAAGWNYGCQVWNHHALKHELLSTRVICPHVIAVILRFLGSSDH